MARIFISYKRVDKEKVFKIKDQIESALGEKCWIDLDGIESDAQFANVIIKAINECEVFLFMYSAAHSQITDYKNDWTVRELDFAQHKKKRIVFVNLDGSPLSDWFYMLFGTMQQVDATSSESLTKLIRDIDGWLGDKTSTNVCIEFASKKDYGENRLDSLSVISDPRKEALFYMTGIAAYKRNDNTSAFEDLFPFAISNHKDAKYYVAGIASRFRRLYTIPSESYDEVFAEANKGNSFALYLLSRFYSCKECDDEKHYHYAKLSSDLGDSYGIYELGRCYQLGIHVNRDEKMHQFLLKRAISLNNPLAVFNYIQDLIEGWSTKSNVLRAINMLNNIDRDDYGEKWFLLGQLHWKGKGVKKNSDIAEKYFKKAIECGLTTGYDELANVYMYNPDTSNLLEPESVKIGYQYLLQGAEYNESACLSHIALCNEYGIGVKKNIKNAIKWYKKAALHGDLHAFYRLAYIYFMSRNTSIDNIANACEWAKKGAYYREPRCLDLLGDICLLEESNENKQSDCIHFYEQASEYSNTNSMLKLYYLYKPRNLWNYEVLQESDDDNPQWIVPSKDKAYQYLSRSAERGNPMALFIYGVILTDIEDDSSDEIVGVKYLKMALEKAVYKAANRLGYVYEYGIGVQKNYDTAKNYYIIAAQNEDEEYYKLVFCNT